MARTAILLVGLAVSASALADTGEVVGIADGDTITVLVDERPVKVRLAEIDAPERGEPWSRRSKQALSEKVFGRTVRLDTVDTDRWGRTVAHVYVGDRHINRELVREGAAWVHRRYLRDPTLLDDEAGARARRVGLWSLPDLPAAAPDPGHPDAGDAAKRRAPPSASAPSQSACGTKRYCREMASCAEARFHLEVCGLGRLDGDGDGIPCEALCRDG